MDFLDPTIIVPPQRIALGVEYKGARYRGWQRQQPGVRSVQETLEDALSEVAAAPIALHCAGRTDCGVHATGQVVHFESPVARPLKAPNANREIVLVWRKNSPRAAEFRLLAEELRAG